MDTILNNFSEGASVIISTHLISDIERILDEVIFIDNGKIILSSDADELRIKEKKSILYSFHLFCDSYKSTSKYQ